MHDCTLQGHVMVDDDIHRECLVCEMPILTDDKISIHVTRTTTAHEFGEGHDPRDIATGNW